MQTLPAAWTVGGLIGVPSARSQLQWAEGGEVVGYFYGYLTFVL